METYLQKKVTLPTTFSIQLRCIDDWWKENSAKKSLKWNENINKPREFPRHSSYELGNTLPKNKDELMGQKLPAHKL